MRRTTPTPAAFQALDSELSALRSEVDLLWAEIQRLRDEHLALSDQFRRHALAHATRSTSQAPLHVINAQGKVLAEISEHAGAGRFILLDKDADTRLALGLDSNGGPVVSLRWSSAAPWLVLGASVYVSPNGPGRLHMGDRHPAADPALLEILSRTSA